jgi:hypothetical protein
MHNGWVGVYARSVQLWNAVMHSLSPLTNHTRDARIKLYGILAVHNSEFVTNMNSFTVPE